MKKVLNYEKNLILGMTLVAIMYFAIGFFGYLKYGDQAAASITLNLPADKVRIVDQISY
jgi:hypothetical protein